MENFNQNNNLPQGAVMSNGLQLPGQMSNVLNLANGQVIMTASPQVVQLSDGQLYIMSHANNINMMPNTPATYVINMQGNGNQLMPPSNGTVPQQVITTNASNPLQQANSLQTSLMPDVVEKEEPLYVNNKQYHRIMKRREARAKLEREGLIPKERSKYLHESRHKHAVNRVRGQGGRFHSKDKVTNNNRTPPTQSLQQNLPQFQVNNNTGESAPITG